MKNRLIYTIFAMIGLLQACTSEVDDLFDKSAQLRMNETLKECRKVLMSAENGWKLNYFPSATQAYGGYVMILKFTEDSVTAAGETTDDPTDTKTSLYSMGSDMGPTLNFDTYNPIIHYFADPDQAGGAGTGKGYEGDYEFIIVNYNSDEIILEGKKTKNIMKMTRLTEPGENYLLSVMATRDKITSIRGVLGYTGRMNGQDISIMIPSDRRMNIQINSDSLAITSFVYTPDGIQFYRPVMIGNKEVGGLRWSETEQTYASDEGVFTTVPDPVYPQYARFLGEYTMEYNYGGTSRKVPIELMPLSYSASEKTYEVKGLPFPLRIHYNVERDCMEILTYTIGDCYVAVWEISGDGSLTWTAGCGLVGQLKEGTDNEYEFVDNGVWGSHIARALILWSASGEYFGFGGDTRFQNIVFVKK